MQLMIQSGDLGPKWFHVALRSMVLMADSNTIVKSNYIAEVLGQDPTFVRKILAKLAKFHFIKAHGGRYGGYSLEMAPSMITLKDVYNSVGITTSISNWNVPSTGSEEFISIVMSKAQLEFLSVLNSYTVEDILNQNNNSKDQVSKS